MAERFPNSDFNLEQDEGNTRLNERTRATSVADIESNRNALCEQLEETTKSGPSNVNMFQLDGSKTIEKKSLGLEMSEESTNSTVTTITEDSVIAEIDEDIAVIQSQAVIAAAKIMQMAAESSSTLKQSNLEVEAAMSNVLGPAAERKRASDSKAARASLTECQRAAQLAHEASEEASDVAASGRSLMDTLSATIEVLESHVVAFLEKARDESAKGTEEGFREADYCHTLASKYESAMEVLRNKGRKVDIAINRVEEAAAESFKYATLAEEVTDENLDESIRMKFSACWWKNKAVAAIIVLLKKEHSALTTMRRVWINVRDDMNSESASRKSSSSSSSSMNEYNQQCEHRDRKTKIAHVAAAFIGISLLSLTSLFQGGSDSFYAVLSLGVLITAWATAYWIHKICMYVREGSNTNATVLEAEPRDGFLENVEKRMKRVEERLQKYNIVPNSDTESETGSLETVLVDDVAA